MRGLDIRLSYAKARVMDVIDPSSEASIEAFEHVFDEAMVLGISDNARGRVEAPLLFNDVPDLLAVWEKGYIMATEIKIPRLFVEMYGPEALCETY